MARAKSVVLSKDEKKALTTSLKAQQKDIKATLKGFEGSVKEADKALKAATKAHADSIKGIEKSVAVSTKELVKVEGQLAVLLTPAE